MKVGRRDFPISRPDKVLFPDEEITKEELADYYRRAARVMLPHVRERPLHLRRFADGVDGQIVDQKRVPRHFPDWGRPRPRAAQGRRLADARARPGRPLRSSTWQGRRSSRTSGCHAATGSTIPTCLSSTSIRRRASSPPLETVRSSCASCSTSSGSSRS